MPNAHACVWLHGAGLSSKTFAAFCADDPKAVCLDLPGHNGAPRAAQPTVLAFAKALLPSLPKTPDRSALIGRLLGMVAMELAAANHPKNFMVHTQS
ncbi:MAG: hypothetical protein AAF590_05280 [Pseudomonadota bacterium]